MCLKNFVYSRSLLQLNPTFPEYTCSLPAVGCKNDNDCHYNAGRVLCEEYGVTAIVHSKKTLPNGEVRSYAYSKKSSPGGYNNNCWYSGWFDCYCADHDRNRKEIWSSGIFTVKAKKMRAVQ